MCSTPRPRQKVKGRTGASGSILSNMTLEARSLFTERANTAQDRRDKITAIVQEQKQQTVSSREVVNSVDIVGKHLSNNLQSDLSYWLTKASLRELLTMLFSNAKKQT